MGNMKLTISNNIFFKDEPVVVPDKKLTVATEGLKSIPVEGLQGSCEMINPQFEDTMEQSWWASDNTHRPDVLLRPPFNRIFGFKGEGSESYSMLHVFIDSPLCLKPLWRPELLFKAVEHLDENAEIHVYYTGDLFLYEASALRMILKKSKAKIVSHIIYIQSLPMLLCALDADVVVVSDYSMLSIDNNNTRISGLTVQDQTNNLVYMKTIQKQYVEIAVKNGIMTQEEATEYYENEKILYVCGNELKVRIGHYIENKNANKGQ